MTEINSKKTLFILGAGPGLSQGIASCYGSSNWKIVLFARHAEHLNELCRTLQKQGIDADGCVLDCARLESYCDILGKAVQKVGTPSCLFYNTCNISPDTCFDADVLHWPERFAGDVAGALACAQCICTPEFSKKNGAFIVTGGTAGMTGLPGYVSLSVDKAALRMLVKCLHDELKEKGIFAGIVQIRPVIKWEDPKGDPKLIAQCFKKFHQKRSSWETIYTGETQCSEHAA